MSGEYPPAAESAGMSFCPSLVSQHSCDIAQLDVYNHVTEESTLSRSNGRLSKVHDGHSHHLPAVAVMGQ